MPENSPPSRDISPLKAQRILHILAELHPDAHCELNFSSPFQLLIATILSAQTTDKKVNAVTEKLFSCYRTPADFRSIPPAQLEKIIHEIGLFHNKAKNILATCRLLEEDFDGQIPRTLEELTRLPGVGRKTANVVLANAFNIPTLAVDTHVFRVSNRLGLAHADNVSLTEEQLKTVVPVEQWIATHHRLIWHGRRVCSARRPDCGVCALNRLCPSNLP
ncbi:MAG: endonuclease III [Peptococcaceae bacterium]|jgi:endonuclease-3|nr:endonuclease III [Peptococcaceae bacterium]